MLFRQRQKTVIRIYTGEGDSVGYIENFQTDESKAFDGSGAIFLKALSRQARSLQELAKDIAQSFVDVDTGIIENDVREFLESLEIEGYLVSGESNEEIDMKDPIFSYSQKKPEIQTDHIPGEKKPGMSALALVAQHFGGKPRLWELRVELSNRCNERCVHCYIPMKERATSLDCDIDTYMFNDVLSQCREAGLVRLALTGGEPMLHQDFLGFLKKAHESDFYTEVFSNLTMLNDEIIETLRSPRTSLVRTSLYSMVPQVHDSITGIPGSFHKTFRGIQRLIEADIQVQIGCMIMKRNKNAYLGVKEWGDRHGIPVIIDPYIYTTFDNSLENADSRLSLDELEKVLTETIEDDVDYRIARKYAGSPTQPPRHDERFCGICTFSFSLSPTGDVYPCAGWQNYILGSVKEEKLIDIVENSPKVKHLLGIKRKDLPACLECEHLDYCHTCLMRNAVESPSGNMLEISKYFCAAAAIKHRLIKEKVKGARNAVSPKK